MNRHKDFWQVTEDSLDKSMRAFKIDPSMRNELLDLYKILSTFSEVPEVLKKLKDKNYKLGILSNGTPSLLNELVKSNSLDKSMKVFEIDASMRNELLDLYKVLSLFPEVLEVLKKLKEKNYKLGILSNGTPSLLNELVKSNNLDNLFDDLFSIEEVGIYKPDSKVYDMPVKKYNIEKDEVAFLSANTWDVSGGGNYGYSSIWVNRNNNIFDNLDYKPTEEVKNLKQLLDII